MFKNKILFIFKRYIYNNNNKILISKNFSFLSIILFIIITRLFKFIIKNKLNKNNFDIKFSKDILNKKMLISIFKTFKKNLIKEFNFINIIKINISTYYYSTRNKKERFFFNNE